MTDVNSFIGKKIEEVEKEFGFTRYIELKDGLLLKREQEHCKLLRAKVRKGFFQRLALKSLRTCVGICSAVLPLLLLLKIRL